MAQTVFYSWQSDLPNNTNRTLIRRALGTAMAELNAELVEADREEMFSADQDTEGVAGSPPIAETILRKIDQCVAFLADVSIVSSAANGAVRSRAHPNPNVLIEYGYALSRRGDARMFVVFNSAFGDVADLPFDLRHKRVIAYRAQAGDTKEATESRTTARKQLAQQLGKQLRLLPFDAQDGLELEAFSPVEPVYGSSCFVSPSEVLGADADEVAGDSPKHLQILDASHVFLRIVPTQTEPELQHREALELVRRLVGSSGLWPLGGSSSAAYGRNERGSFVFSEPRTPTADGSKAIVANITQVFRTREVWGVDAASLSGRTDDGVRYVPCKAVESSLRKAVQAYVEAALRSLQVAPPVRLIVGLSKVRGHRLAVDSRSTDGEIMQDEVVLDELVDDVSAAQAALNRFFLAYWDAAGLRRSEA